MDRYVLLAKDYPLLDLYNSPSRTDTDMACAEP